jgi:hypothetical protein
MLDKAIIEGNSQSRQFDNLDIAKKNSLGEAMKSMKLRCDRRSKQVIMAGGK